MRSDAKKRRLAGTVWLGMSIVLLPSVVWADTTGPADPAATLAAQHNGYVVTGKELSAQVAAAVIAVERCERANGTAMAPDLAGSAACDAARSAEHKAERALVQRGRAVLDANEPAAVDRAYANISVIDHATATAVAVDDETGHFFVTAVPASGGTDTAASGLERLMSTVRGWFAGGSGRASPTASGSVSMLDVSD